MNLVRLLDAVAVLCGLAVLSTLVYWWWRPEEVFLVLLGVLAIRLVVAPVPVPHVRPRRAVAVGVALYAVYFSAVTLSRHWTFRTHALDLGYYVQLTWNLARGAGPYVSLPEMHAWGDHLSPIMYLFVPAFWLAPGPGVLLVAQSIALALGGLAVFALATQRLGDERPAAVFAVLYLLNPSLHGINVRDFHSAALAIRSSSPPSTSPKQGDRGFSPPRCSSPWPPARMPPSPWSAWGCGSLSRGVAGCWGA